MASTNKTPHLGLCQWEATDHFLMDDMNDTLGKIDAAIGGLSRVKLFDVTVTEAVPLIQLDFSDVDLEQFAELEMHMSFASKNKYMRINEVTQKNYICVHTSGSNSSNSIYIDSGTSRLSLSREFYSVAFIERLELGKLRREFAPELNSITLFTTTSETNFAAGDHISVWGVRV